MDEPIRDPIELEKQAVVVAAEAAGISQGQAMLALDAAATLMRRASVIRNIEVIRARYADWPDEDPGKVEVEYVIQVLLNAIDEVQSVPDSD